MHPSSTSSSSTPSSLWNSFRSTPSFWGTPSSFPESLPTTTTTFASWFTNSPFSFQLSPPDSEPSRASFFTPFYNFSTCLFWCLWASKVNVNCSPELLPLGILPGVLSHWRDQRVLLLHHLHHALRGQAHSPGTQRLLHCLRFHFFYDGFLHVFFGRFCIWLYFRRIRVEEIGFKEY